MNRETRTRVAGGGEREREGGDDGAVSGKKDKPI